MCSQLCSALITVKRCKRKSRFLIKCAKLECYQQDLQECCLFYGSDLDAHNLQTQLQIFAGVCEENQLDTGCLLPDIIKLFQNLSKPQISLMSQVARLLKLIIVMPATNAFRERSFSAMRRLKHTWERTWVWQDSTTSWSCMCIRIEQTP